MKLFRTTLLVFSIFLFASFTSPQRLGLDCTAFHEGRFTYPSDKGMVKVTINGEKHMEYHQKGKYYIESTIKWVSSCEYTATLIKATLPDFPYNPGSALNVKIEKIEGKKAFYSCAINGDRFTGVLTKVK